MLPFRHLSIVALLIFKLLANSLRVKRVIGSTKITKLRSNKNLKQLGLAISLFLCPY